LVKQEHTLLKNLAGALLKDRLLALPTNNRQDRKGFTGTNTLADYKKVFITDKKVL
jgi:hypothetical protein